MALPTPLVNSTKKPTAINPVLPRLAPPTGNSGTTIGNPNVIRTSTQAPGFQDIRSQVVGVPGSALGSQAGGLLGGLLPGYASSGLPGYHPVGGPNYSAANGLYNQAIGKANGASISGGGSVAGPDFSASNSLYNQALAQSRGANIAGVGAVAGPNFGQANQYLQQAAGQIGGATMANQGRVAAQDPTQTYAALQAALSQAYSPQQQQVRGMSMQDLQNLHSAPDRAKLAAEAFRISNEMSAPAFAQDMRSVGQNAAAFGRTGAGMTTNELTDLALARAKNQNLMMAQLSNDAAGLTMQDRLNTLGATTGYQGQLSNEDLNRAGFTSNTALNKFNVGSTVRGQNVGERDFAAQQGLNQANLALARASGYQGIGGQYASQAQATTANAQQNAARALQQQGMQADLAMGQAGLTYNVGGQRGNQAIATTQNAQTNASRALQASMAQADLAMNQAGMMYNVGGQRSGQATNTAQFAMQNAQNQQQNALSRAQLQQSKIGTLADIQNTQFGQGMQRAQLQTQQQGFQQQMAQQAIDNGARQQALQDQLLNSAYNRQLGQAGAAAQYGFGNDPYSLMMQGGQYQQQQASAQAQAIAEQQRQAAMQQALQSYGGGGYQAPATLPNTPTAPLPIRAPSWGNMTQSQGASWGRAA